MRQVVLDTETTGLETSQGHRIIEIGCVEVIDRKLTGRNYHQYIKPDIEVGDSVNIHGITDEFLQDKPLFADIAADFLQFIQGAELVIHNAAFDVGFMDHEFALLGAPYQRTENYCTVMDTLLYARKKHPGQKNNLDALCKRYGIDNSHRELHGALLDAEILADVYLAMTGGQTKLMLEGQGDGDEDSATEIIRLDANRPRLRVIRADGEALSAHEAALDAIDKKSEGALWRRVLSCDA